MGERKVLNKYYPPDFDPSLIPRARKPKNDQQTVRMMLPMSVRCLTCGEYLYRGKKFNAKKETVVGEEYLGLRIFRFYMKCTRCKGEFTIKTDPERADYTAEHNVSRNFEPWRNKEDEAEAQKQKREAEEEGDAMKQLENRTMDSKVELDILDALADIKSLNTRNARLDLDRVVEARMEAHERAQRREEEEEDERLVREAFMRRVDIDAGGTIVKRLDEDDDDEADDGVDAALAEPLGADALLLAPLAPARRPAVKKEKDGEEETALKKEGKQAEGAEKRPDERQPKKRKTPFPIVAVVAKPKAGVGQKRAKVEPPFSPVAAKTDDADEGASLLGLDY